MKYIAAMTPRPHDCRVRIICAGPGAIGRQGAWTLWSATMDAEHSVPKSWIQMMGPPRPKCKRSCRTTSFPVACSALRGPPRLERDAALASRTPDVWMSFTHEDRAIPDLRAMPRPSVRARDHLAWRTCAYARWVQAGAGAPAVAGRASAPAAYRGNLDRVRSLVEAGADVTARD